MATQPALARARTSALSIADPGAWRGYHLVYHGDRDRLLSELVLPTVTALLSRGEITRFFFIRYGLGGPHVRLRVLPTAGRSAAVAERVRSACETFFARFPSVAPLPDAVVRQQNRGVVAADPSAAGEEDLVYPDNSAQECPVRFEVERYGGPDLLALSVELFTVSSAAALRFLDEHGSEPRGRRLPRVLHVLARYAWGLAEDEDGFLALAGYAERFFPSDPMAGFLARGDEAYERSRDTLRESLKGELLALAGGGARIGTPRAPAGAAHSLGLEARELPVDRRWFLAASHIHMTANRLGLLNPEEVYLSRILSRAALDLRASEPSLWRAAWEAHREQRNRPAESLSRYAGAALEGLVGDRPVPPAARALHPPNGVVASSLRTGSYARGDSRSPNDGGAAP